jgi:hypothetical protein
MTDIAIDGLTRALSNSRLTALYEDLEAAFPNAFECGMAYVKVLSWTLLRELETFEAGDMPQAFDLINEIFAKAQGCTSYRLVRVEQAEEVR